MTAIQTAMQPQRSDAALIEAVNRVETAIELRFPNQIW